MKCIYYSKYPWQANDFKKVDAQKHGCNWSGDALDMPFRLYKAAVCESEHKDPFEMVDDLFEALDMPFLDNRNEPFKVAYNGLEFDVKPTKHYYGATNEADGVFEIDGIYYIVYSNVTLWFKDWESAVRRAAMFENNSRYYLRGIDYTKPE